MNVDQLSYFALVDYGNYFIGFRTSFEQTDTETEKKMMDFVNAVLKQ